MVRIPGRAGHAVEGRIRDISYNGLSFWLEPREQPQLSLTQFEADVELGSGRITVLCKVCFAQPGFGERVLYGTQIMEHRCDPVLWHQIVEGYLHPNTSVGSRWCEAIWELYEKCGYFNLSGKSPLTFGTNVGFCFF